MSIEALKQALNALETIERFLDPLAKWQIRKPKDGGPMITVYPQKVAEEAINELRQAVAETKQREWVGLTDEDEIPWDGVDAKSFAKAIEAKLKEKNGG